MADKFSIKKPQAIFRRSLRLAPAHPRGDRILVRELPPETVTEGGLHMAEKAIERLFSGYIVAAGEKAMDVMYDGGDEIGDLICYAKYAGVVEAWKHVVGDDDMKCDHEGAMDHVPKPSVTLEGLGSKPDLVAAKKWSLVLGGCTENVTLRECRSCGTLVVTERVIVMSIDDILLNVDAQERIESGTMRLMRGVNADGKTCHYIDREMKTMKEVA